MDKQLLIQFILLNISNVIISTIKSLCTVKGGKALAATANAVAYGLNTIVTIYMLCDLPLMYKAGVVALCNLVGVYVVKFAEEKARKDKLWKVEATIPTIYKDEVNEKLREVPHSYIEGVGKYVIFNCYCATQNESALVRDILNHYDVKYFVTESKIL